MTRVIRPLVGLWGMSAAQSAALGAHCARVSARAGEVIARRGAELPGVLVVRTGVVKLALRQAEGDERVLRLVPAGESFGEPTALLGNRCRYDAVALTDAKLFSIAPAAIFAMLERDRQFARRLVLALAARSYAVLTELEAATTQRSAQRLAGYLASLPARNGTRGGPSVQLPVSKTIVAALLGMKKETLSRLLRRFTAEGMIDMKRREIEILDPVQLSAAAARGP